MNNSFINNKELIQLCRENGIIKIGVFGSVARGTATEKSDLDLLVQFSESQSLLTHVRVERELSQLLGKKVDLLTEAAISPYLRDIIKSELQVLYEA
jgi:predicted nucleotidyltransferase